MNTPPRLAPDDFAAFFHAVHGDDPFPWQEQLLRRVVETGWPTVLDLPTGTGKTAALDVAIFALALDAGAAPRSSPLRIVYVVDRRTIVDQAYDRAKKIRRALGAPDNDVVWRVRERLARYAHERVPIRTALLRGGIARDDAWARAPDQPLIAVSTVDQAGSRLLFRGYGVADSMKPVHAGLLGNDVLYLLDEVHLSQPFRQTLTAIARYRTWAERLLPSPFIVVEMSATPGDESAEAFHLGDADRAHPVLSARLRSAKPVSLVSTNARGFAKEIETHVLLMLERPGATIAVVVNRVRSARDLHRHLREAVAGRSVDVHLLTGRMRPFDRDALESQLLERIRSGRTRSADDRPMVVVATQTIEAGADFDFDGLVTECASLDALRQRFGRLDRLGRLTGSARGAIVLRTDTLKGDPVYGEAIGKTWEWLQTIANGQVVDFGIEALSVPGDADRRGLLTPKTTAPVLLPSHLDAWSQTAPIPEPDPDVALWLHGPERGVADVQIVWRADLTEALLKQAVESGKESLAAEVAIEMVDALPPSSAEAMSVPFLAAKQWLKGLPEPETFDVEGAAKVDEDVSSPRSPRAAMIWQGEQSRVVWPDDISPGQTLIVSAAYGGIDHYNWAPASEEPVRDVAELAAWNYRRRPILRLQKRVVRSLFDGDVVLPIPDPDAETPNDREVVIEWLENQRVTVANGELRALLDWLAADTRLRVEPFPPPPGEEDGEPYFLVAATRRPPVDEELPIDDRPTADDDSKSSFTGAEITLAAHLTGVAAMASGFAERVGLPSDLTADLRLAGEWHDAGKADPRFQRWLHGGSEFKALVQPEPLAKGTAKLSNRIAMRRARERAGYPAGVRHELMSLVLMASAGNALTTHVHDWMLVQHVVASHHGHCRPLAPWVPDTNPVDVTFNHGDITCKDSSAHELSRLDSGVAERFWRMVQRYGWWGLAWLETLLRLADHRQSEREQITAGKHDG